MVGAMTTSQKAATRKKYDVRVRRIQGQLEWYQQNNHLYAEVNMLADWNQAINEARTRVVVDETVSELDSTDDRSYNTPDISNLHQENEIGPLNSTERVDNDDLLHSHMQTGPQLLDCSAWRHNTPAPTFHAVSTSEETLESSATGLVSDQRSMDTESAIQIALKKQNVVVYRSTGIMSDFDPAFWSYAFCELFPYGRGGLDEPRDVPISIIEFIRYCMRLSSRKHSRHRSFAMVGFDVVARHNVFQTIYIRARMAPDAMMRAARISRDSLEQYVEYKQQRIAAISESKPLPSEPNLDPHINELYSNISAGMRAYWGSNEERASARTDLFSMQVELGQPTIFFTLSPDCSSTYRIASLAGEIPNDFLSAMGADINECLTFSRARLGHIAAENPYACAR